MVSSNIDFAAVAVWCASATNLLLLWVWWRRFSVSTGAQPILDRLINEELDFRSANAVELEKRAAWRGKVDGVLRKAYKEHGRRNLKYFLGSLIIWGICLGVTALALSLTHFGAVYRINSEFLGVNCVNLIFQTVDNVTCGALSSLTSFSFPQSSSFSHRLLSFAFTAVTSFTVGSAIALRINRDKFRKLITERPEQLALSVKWPDRPTQIVSLEMPQVHRGRSTPHGVSVLELGDPEV